ncbi:hypothetical protein [Desulfobacter latus]|uniref:GIY-YIG domain-containing protein n=1 Tax=Desulfobacter latus TaxID=2292 RepID=A0A850SX23_9BACT|nr:hypothetical protein [Desulfobacter latus]NWH05699.1 hypothetical protein [Desulfobacter latus]
MSIKVDIEWTWIEWNKGNTWKKNILPQLTEANINEEQLERCVYIIRVNGLFAINYPSGISPTLYIGEGNFKNRIIQHKNWFRGLIDLVGEFPFLIGICIPRVRNSYEAYKDLEAALLIEFKGIYGCAPLKNKQLETRKCDYEYQPNEEFRGAIMIGKGVRYYWAIEPMRSNDFYDDYFQTCD